MVLVLVTLLMMQELLSKLLLDSIFGTSMNEVAEVYFLLLL